MTVRDYARPTPLPGLAGRGWVRGLRLSSIVHIQAYSHTVIETEHCMPEGGHAVAPYAVNSFWKTFGPPCHCIGVLSDAVSSISQTAIFNDPQRRALRARSGHAVAPYAVNGFWKTFGPSCHCIGVLSDAASSISQTAIFNDPKRRTLRARSGHAVAHSRLSTLPRLLQSVPVKSCIPDSCSCEIAA